MLHNNRRKQLLRLLSEHQELGFADLVKRLHSSPATVRRDITWLAERNLLTRRRGVASYLPQTGTAPTLGSMSFQERLASRGEQKRAIARHAASLCQEGETIIVNGGSTTCMMSGFMPKKNLKILTNSFETGRQLLENTENEVNLTAGQVYREQDVILSPFDSDIPQYHYAAKMFMGAFGISEHGLVEADPILIQAELRLIGLAEELIILADSSKFERSSGLLLCALNRVTRVITDWDAPEAAIAMLRSAGVRVDIVEPEAAAYLVH